MLVISIAATLTKICSRNGATPQTAQFPLVPVTIGATCSAQANKASARFAFAISGFCGVPTVRSNTGTLAEGMRHRAWSEVAH